jgi:hypothetical protein
MNILILFLDYQGYENSGDSFNFNVMHVEAMLWAIKHSGGGQKLHKYFFDSTAFFRITNTNLDFIDIIFSLLESSGCEKCSTKEIFDFDNKLEKLWYKMSNLPCKKKRVHDAIPRYINSCEMARMQANDLKFVV